MAKKHKNLDNIQIQWDGDLSKPLDGSAQSSPDNVDVVWGGHVPVWFRGCYNDVQPAGVVDGVNWDSSKCAEGVMDDPIYYEDFNIFTDSGEVSGITVADINMWRQKIYGGKTILVALGVLVFHTSAIMGSFVALINFMNK